MTETLHPEETITSIILMRHGDTVATEQGRLYSNPEAELTERGINQAGHLASWLSSQDVDFLLTSPAKRVRGTADIIASALNTAPIVVDGLDEWHVGEWDGRTYLDIKRNDPDLYQSWVSDPINNSPPGGESISQFYLRARDSIIKLLAKYEGKRLGLVTHAGIIRGAILYALTIPVESFWRLTIPVGSAARLDFSANFATLHYMSLRPNISAPSPSSLGSSAG